MKKIAILMIAFIISGMGLLAGCLEEENKSDVSLEDENQLLGIWQNDDGMQFIFFEDGIMKCDLIEMSINGTYKLSGDVLNITFLFGGGYSQNSEFTFELTNSNTLMLTSKPEGDVDIFTRTTANSNNVYASADPIEGAVPLSVDFRWFVRWGDTYETMTYVWDFGDGQTSSEQYTSRDRISTEYNTTHIYEGAGAYNAILTATDDKGKTDAATIVITATASLGPGYSSNNPAPIGSTLTYEGEDDWKYGDYRVNVTLLEIIRGEEAWDLLEAETSLNEAPRPGTEYILAKIRFEYLESTTGERYTGFSFYSVSENGSDYESVYLFEPDSLDWGMYPGDPPAEGWKTFEVRIDDEHPLLTMGRDWQGKGGIWFELYTS